MNIRSKLLMGFGGVSSLFVVVILFNLHQAREINRAIGQLTNETLPVITALQDIRFAGQRVVSSTSEFGLIASQNANEVASNEALEQEIEELTESGKKAYPEAFARYSAFVEQYFPEKGDTLREIDAGAAMLFESSANLMDLFERRAPSEEILEAQVSLEDAEQGFLRVISDALKHEFEEVAERQEAVVEHIEAETITVLAVTVVALVLSIAGGLLFAERITTPIRALRDAAAGVGAGHLDPFDVKTSGDEIGELADAFGRMVRDLDAAQSALVRGARLAAIGQATATVSHELRNPLGAIRSGIDAIARFAGDDNPRMSRAVSLVDRSQTRCTKIVTELLDFTRMRELERRSIEMDEWLNRLLDEYDLPPAIKLERNINSGVSALADGDRLDQAVRNVLDNARHAMEEAVRVEGDSSDQVLSVRARVADGNLEISIADSGAGIPPDELGKVFEPLHSTKTFGVGLGLPVVKQVMEQHGGDVSIESEAGRGAKLVLRFPLIESDMAVVE